jgi:phosphonate transport system substrate-binding protein
MGRLVPEWCIRRVASVSSAEFFAAPPAYARGPEEVVARVAAGAYDAGALDERVHAELLAAGAPDARRVRVIWTTPPFVNRHWSGHPELEAMLGADALARARDALLSIDDADALAPLECGGALVAVEERDFAQLAHVAHELGLVP